MSTDYVKKPPGHWSRGPREFTGHNHLNTLFFGPSDHEDRRPQLKNRAKNRVMLCYVEGVLFPNPIPSPHVSSGYEVINHYKICSFNLTVEGPVKLCKSLSLLVAWVLWCTLWRWAQYKASSWWQKCTLKFMFECFSIIKKNNCIDWTLSFRILVVASECVWSVAREFYIGFILNVCNHSNRSRYTKYCIYFHMVLYVNVSTFSSMTLLMNNISPTLTGAGHRWTVSTITGYI